jgi:hypothetical protein
MPGSKKVSLLDWQGLNKRLVCVCVRAYVCVCVYVCVSLKEISQIHKAYIDS